MCLLAMSSATTSLASFSQLKVQIFRLPQSSTLYTNRDFYSSSRQVCGFYRPFLLPLVSQATVGNRSRIKSTQSSTRVASGHPHPPWSFKPPKPFWPSVNNFPFPRRSAPTAATSPQDFPLEISIMALVHCGRPGLFTVALQFGQTCPIQFISVCHSNVATVLGPDMRYLFTRVTRLTSYAYNTLNKLCKKHI